MTLIVLLLIILFLFGGFGWYGPRHNFGPYHYGSGVGLILIIVVVLLLTGYLR